MSRGSSELVRALIPVIEALEDLGVPHYISGSVASSAHGLPRSTQDVDLVAALGAAHVDAFAGELESDYYIDADVVRDAIARRSSFNAIHLETMIKLDVFTLQEREFAAEALQRAQPTRVRLERGAPPMRVSTPEDIVLHKLDWYEKGHRISERQWLDVSGVIKIQGASLDLIYLRKWSGELGLADLLEEALREAGVSEER